MLGLRSSLAALVALVVLVLSRPGAAAPPSLDAGAACSVTEARLAQAESLVSSCEAARRTAEAGSEACSSSLEEEREAHGRSESETRTCEAQRDALCREADRFVKDLVHGHVTNVGTCVLSAEQAELMALLRSWDNVSSELGRLDAYVAGESDVLPSATGDSLPEREVERLVGLRGDPRFYRRLLTEALRVVAPKFWLQTKDGSALDAWFARSEPLSPAIVEEAQRERGGGTSLTVAVRLV